MNHFQTGSVQNVTLVSIEILQLEFKTNQTCAGHSRGSFARNIWSVHCRNTEVEFQTNPMPYLKYRENAGRKIWNWVLWQIQLNGELEMLQRSRGSSFEVSQGPQPTPQVRRGTCLLWSALYCRNMICSKLTNMKCESAKKSNGKTEHRVSSSPTSGERRGGDGCSVLAVPKFHRRTKTLIPVQR